MRLPQNTNIACSDPKMPMAASRSFFPMAVPLKLYDTDEVLKFLRLRPVHTVVMTSFIIDNGIESPLNRGTFYGSRDSLGNLEGVALIGHVTLVESRSLNSLHSLAYAARNSPMPINLMMSDHSSVESFWQAYSNGAIKPRLTCSELLFEIGYVLPDQNDLLDLRLATAEELLPVAEAHAQVALSESGIDPLKKDREGFLDRVLRRIDQGRVYGVFEDGRLIFKADVVAETPDVIYLEGIYVAPDLRGRRIGSRCLSKLSSILLQRTRNVCLLSNAELKNAHRSFFNAGFKNTDSCTTLFV